VSNEQLADTLRQALAEQGAIVSHVEVQRVPTIPKTAAGKVPLIKSNLSNASQPAEVPAPGQQGDKTSEKRQWI
jgi:acyl-coenzyme A synthetase/AMP-(fatty) acid ligase